MQSIQFMSVQADVYGVYHTLNLEENCIAVFSVDVGSGALVHTLIARC